MRESNDEMYVFATRTLRHSRVDGNPKVSAANLLECVSDKFEPFYLPRTGYPFERIVRRALVFQNKSMF